MKHFGTATRILLVHNRYQQPGGEDTAFAAESKLLEAYGHHVVEYTSHNAQVSKMTRSALVKATLWNKAVNQELRALIRKERPQVAHFHNTFPLRLHPLRKCERPVPRPTGSVNYPLEGKLGLPESSATTTNSGVTPSIRSSGGSIIA